MFRVEMTEKEKSEKRDGLVEKWNKGVLCDKPSAKAIRRSKRAIQRMRRDRRDLVEDQDSYIRETLEQEKVLREYKGE